MYRRDEKEGRVADNYYIRKWILKYCNKMGSKPYETPTGVQICSVSLYLLGDICEIAVYFQLIHKAVFH